MINLTKGHIPEFDGLRALAAIAVVLGHSSVKDSFLKATKSPSLAVAFFFVLSGFLITRILLGMRGRVDAKVSRIGTELKVFYARRVLRIFPPFYAFLVFFLIIGSPFVVETFWWHAAYATNFYPTFRGPLVHPLPHFWTLAVEEQFYLCWPFVVMLVPGRHLKRVLIGFIGAAVAFRCVTFDNASGLRPPVLLPIASLDTLALGGFLAVLAREHTHASRRLIQRLSQIGLWVGLPTIIGGVALALPKFGYPVLYEITSRLAMGLFSVAILNRFATRSGGWFARLLRSRTSLYLGKISYGIYIYHYPFIHGFDELAKRLGWIHVIAYRFPFVLACTLITATLSWFLIERPLCELKRFFSYDAAPPIDPAALAVPIT